jgi:hypothetical protein
LDLSDKLVKDLMTAEKGSTKTEAIEKAIEGYLKRKRLDGLKSMSGRTRIVDYSHELRRMEIRESKHSR